ncbi:hypothetical protein EJ04DRAFT_340836 [Polyplosphaeria fusca]|uniref:Uncharacterized protein n=1 Tax=Polyplosphaeria fusca TaxID=682080 RepID=A0A9P4QT79_9PLEO|nr:hypothetical protein EJ04DRAFT_340836 [Polyplosphaeria fusca]
MLVSWSGYPCHCFAMPHSRSRSRPGEIIIPPANTSTTSWCAIRPPTPRILPIRSKTTNPSTRAPSSLSSNLSATSPSNPTKTSPAPRVPPVSYWEPDTPSPFTTSPFSPHSWAFFSLSTAHPGTQNPCSSPALPTSPLLSPRFMNPRTPPVPPSLLLPPCPPSPYYPVYVAQMMNNGARRHSIAEVLFEEERGAWGVGRAERRHSFAVGGDKKGFLPVGRRGGVDGMVHKGGLRARLARVLKGQ